MLRHTFAPIRRLGAERCLRIVFTGLILNLLLAFSEKKESGQVGLIRKKEERCGEKGEFTYLRLASG